MRLTYLVFYCLLLFFTCCSGYEIAWAQPPQPPLEEELAPPPEILLPELKGLILVGDPLQVSSDFPPFEGVRCVCLDVPGGNACLIQRLECFCIHQPLTYPRIEEIKREIICYYREHAHPVVMVFVPEQTVCNGILQLVVIEARVGALCVKGNCFTPDESILQWVRLAPGCGIDERLLLEDLSWMNTINCFRRVNALYAPGLVPGTTDVHFCVQDRRPWRIYLGGDNTGTPLIGRDRWFIGANVANIFFPDNTFTYQYTTSSNFRKMQGHLFQFATPLPWRHTLGIFGAYSTAHPSFDEKFRGHAKTFQVSGRYTVPHWCELYSYLWQLNYEVGFDIKGANSSVFFGEQISPSQETNVHIGQFVFGANACVNRNLFNLQAGFEVFYSPGKLFGHQDRANFEALRANASAHYCYERFFGTFDTPLPFKTVLWLQGRFQLANANLLPSEQFAIGGYDTVRGYDERIVNGDNASCVNVELRSIPFPIKFFKGCYSDALILLGFFDAGHVWFHEEILGFPFSQTLLGAGAGLRYKIGCVFSLRLDVGVPLHRVRVESPAKPIKNKVHAHVSAVLSY